MFLPSHGQPDLVVQAVSVIVRNTVTLDVIFINEIIFVGLEKPFSEDIAAHLLRCLRRVIPALELCPDSLRNRYHSEAFRNRNLSPKDMSSYVFDHGLPVSSVMVSQSPTLMP